MAAITAFALLAVPDAGRLGSDAAAVDTLADRDAGLAAVVKQFGGAAAVLGCGHPYTVWFDVPALAWDLGVEAGTVEDSPHGRQPVVFALASGDSGLIGPVPRKHMRVAARGDGWNVIDRCAAAS